MQNIISLLLHNLVATIVLVATATVTVKISF